MLLCVFFTDTKMEEWPTEEKEVMKILTEVAVARREAEIVSFANYTILSMENQS